jgi:hypothetical protein
MKNKVKGAIFVIIAVMAMQIGVYAATIVLKTGLTITGKLIDRNDEEITIQDPGTNQLRVIKAVFIRDLVLTPDEQKIVEKKKQKQGAISGENLLITLQPTVGLMPGIAYPIGKLASKINLGYGFYAFTDVVMPNMPTIFKLRLGLSVGFLYHTTKTTDYSPTIMHVPFNAYAKFQFITDVGVRPYIKLGGGFTPVMSGSATDMAPGFIAGVGLGYAPAKIPFMEFFIEAGFMMVFESLRGDYLTANIGVAYRFGAASVVSQQTGGK